MKRLRTRFYLFIFIPTMIFFIGMTIHVSMETHSIVKQDGEEMLQATGDSLAEELKLELEKPLASVRTLSATFAGMLEQEITPSREEANVMLQQLFEHHPQIASAWMYWEEDAFDGNDSQYVNTEGHDETGRFIPVWTRTDSGDFFVEPLREEGETVQHLNAVLESGEPAIWEPFTYELNGEEQLVSSIVAPITYNGETVGMTGVYISLDYLHYRLNERTFYNRGFAGLISNEGIVLSHRNPELIGTNFFDIEELQQHERLKLVQDAVNAGGKAVIENHSDVLNEEVYSLFTPISIQGITTPWSAFISAPADEVTKEAGQLTTMIVTVSTVVIIILAILILFVTQSVVAPIRRAVEAGQQMAQGDFTGELQSKSLNRKDEIGELARIFAQLRDNMSEVIRQVQDSSRTVLQSAESLDEGTSQASSATNEVTSSIEEVSRSAEEQLQSAEESAKVMEDMTDGVQRVANAASSVAETASDMTERTNEGQTTVENAISQMERIQQETNTTKKVIDDLQTGANQIEDIVTMITDISEQTNLLALNAAIEAARAGDAGQGFAVVADEVRKLADETKESALNIHEIVETIQGQTGQATASMNTSEREVTEGMTRIHAVGDVFGSIKDSVQTVSKEIEELAAVAQEMSAMSEEVAATAAQIAESAEVSAGNTQQVAAASEQQLATMEEIERTSQSLRGLVQQLHEMLNRFRVS